MEPDELIKLVRSQPDPVAYVRDNPQITEIIGDRWRQDVTLPPASKYHNARAEFEGLRFQSGHERDVIANLVKADAQHGIFGLRLQTIFLLPGKTSYRADATYADLQDGHLKFHVVDAKIWDEKKQKFIYPPEYRIKKRQMKEIYGVEILEL